ncbi:MAG: hypothetical protein E7041_02325 [Lentisphaerae bacterium]|nr:hypothetical protein [Lentisphaerota bacterium]
MEKIAASAAALLGKNEDVLKSGVLKSSGAVSVYADSIHKLGDAAVMMCRDDEKRFLLVVAKCAKCMPAGFEGDTVALSDGSVALCGALSAANAAALRQHFPWCAPQSLRNVRTTVGCGDRLGLATTGHILAAKKVQISPVLAQQSMRELTMTNRTFRGVVDDACFLVFAADYRDGYGADGDHLKTIKDIDTALAAGMPMITLDLSDVMNAAAGDWDAAKIDAAFVELPGDLQKLVIAEYADKDFVLGDDVAVKIDALTAKRCAVMYTSALDFAKEVHEHLKAARGEEFDLEISIDETSSPTLPSHHLFIVRELRRRSVEFSSLAPRFIGEFQKAIDYIGDLAEFDRQFKVHALIAKNYGNYKISVHSGSDKFAVYPTVGRETRHYLHLKTAGTSWLVAVTVIAKRDPQLYREMHQCALDNVKDMLKLYHITADFNKIPALDTLKDEELAALMDMPEARQLLHICYGPILTGNLRERFFKAMHKFEADYDAAIEAHFDKHLTLLGVPAKN